MLSQTREAQKRFSMSRIQRLAVQAATFSGTATNCHTVLSRFVARPFLYARGASGRDRIRNLTVSVRNGVGEVEYNFTFDEVADHYAIYLGWPVGGCVDV